MLRETIWRGRTIYKRGEVGLMESSPSFYHFKVRQRSGEETDVWYSKNKQGIMEWECNALSPERNKKGEKWGCVMNTKIDRTKPHCSHTLSAAILLKNIKREKNGKKENT